MALCAAEIELAEAPVEQRAPGFDERLEPFVVHFRDRHATRLPPDIGGERQQVAAFERQRRRAGNRKSSVSLQLNPLLHV
jgi:hypothetical protein